ncbi:MAG: hypothetical protein J6S67_20675 [Methanobrevibacter sp.]|nr:hypothetical protein [Methanobrevibacter sp.]
MLLYHGMYNIAHFEINNSVPLYTNTAVGDAYDYKRLRKVCFESGGAYINDSVIDGGHVRGGAHVTIQEDSIFLNIVPEDPTAGIVYGLTFFLGADERTMYVYAEKREGGGGGESGVHSFNGRRGSVVSADGDYNAGMVGYDNTNSGLVADDVQSAIDEIAYENENLSDDVETLQEDVGDLQEDVASHQTAIGALQTNVAALQTNVSSLETNVGAIGEDVEDLQEDVTAMATAIASKPDNLVDLNDVNIATPTDGQVLKYNSASQKWENGAGGGGGASALNDLSDVTIANPSSGQALLYDGTKWENANLPAPPTVPDDLNDLSDVDITSPSSGQVLKFNSTTQKWENANESGGGTAQATSYDNTISGLNATNVQDAIDEVVTEASTKYGLITEVTFTNSATSDTIKKRLYNLISDVLRYCQSMANDEAAVLMYMIGGNRQFVASDAGIFFDNNITAIASQFFRITTHINLTYTMNISVNISTAGESSNHLLTAQITSGGAVTITDGANTTTSDIYEIHIHKYKKII